LIASGPPTTLVFVPRSLRTLALVLAFSLMPGAAEAVENVVHLAGEGHLAHAAKHEDRHEPEGDEHGCNSVFHACTCHAPASFLVRSVTRSVAPDVPVRDRAPRWQARGLAPSPGVVAGLLRPPIR
jgi:hypothetical protein